MFPVSRSERAADQFLHDLVGAAEDARHARTAPGPRDRIFVHVTGAAVQLQALVHDFPLQFGVPKLGGRAFDRGQFLLGMAVERPVEMRPADLQLGLEVREHEAGVLEIEHRLAEGFAVLHERDGIVIGLLRRSLGRHGDRKALLRQLAHQIDEALALFAEAVGHRNAHVIEEQLRRVRSVLADLVEIAPAREAFAIGLDQDDRHALPCRLHLGIGLGADQDQVGILAIGDIGLGTIDDIMVAVLLGGGANALKVRSRARLGHRDRGDRLARHEPRQPFLLLLLGPVLDDIVHHDVRLEREAERRSAEIGGFLVDDGVIAEVEAQAAIFFRNGGAEQAELARLGPDLARHDLFLVPFHRIGRDLVLHEAAHGLAEGLVIGGIGGAGKGIERHGFSPVNSRPRDSCRAAVRQGLAPR